MESVSRKNHLSRRSGPKNPAAEYSQTSCTIVILIRISNDASIIVFYTVSIYRTLALLDFLEEKNILNSDRLPQFFESTIYVYIF